MSKFFILPLFFLMVFQSYAAGDLKSYEEEFCTLSQSLLKEGQVSAHVQTITAHLEQALAHIDSDLFIREGGIHLPPEEDPCNAINSAKRGKALDAFNFIMSAISSQGQLDFLRQFLPSFQDKERDSDWSKLLLGRNKMVGARQEWLSQWPSKPYAFWEEEEWKKNVFLFADKVLEHLSPEEDALVAVGNTPQFVAEAVRVKAPSLKIIQVALSGWPNKEKQGLTGGLVKNILTSTGLKNYLSYLDSIGLNKTLKGKIFFLDLFGGGGGPIFLANLFMKQYGADEKPELTLMALNAIDEKYAVKNSFPYINLDPKEEYRRFLRTLDSVSHDEGESLRFTPDFPAWRWESWKPGSFSLPVGSKAKEILETVIRSSSPLD